MKTFLTTAAVVAALTMPAFAEGDDASTKAGSAKDSVKASTTQNTPGSEAMGQGAMGQQRKLLPGAATTGAASEPSSGKDDEKNTSGADGSGSGGPSGR